MNQMYKINGNPEQFADLNVFHKLSQQFLPYAQEKLGFDKPVSINLLSDPQNAKNPLGKTAYYDPNKMEVTVFVDKRHVKDILRSMSHELVHHTQCCRGEFDGGIKTGPGYAQEDEHMREMERQAYEKGQMILRDFEDKCKKENQQMSRINEVNDEVKARTAPRDKANKADFLPKDVRDKINDKEDVQKEEVDEGKKKKCPHCDGDAPKSECICGQLEEGEEGKCPVCKKVKCESNCSGKRDGMKETNENWTRKNKDQLLFERLTKMWTK